MTVARTTGRGWMTGEGRMTQEWLTGECRSLGRSRNETKDLRRTKITLEQNFRDSVKKGRQF